MTKKLLFIVLIFTSVQSLLATKKGLEVERKSNFNLNWKFNIADEHAFSEATLNDTDWRTVNLPHDWSVEGKSDKNAVSGGDGGFFPTGTAWYRKSFTVPSTFENKKVSIYFEGVYMNAEVFINGISLGIHPYGYTSFEKDLSPYLKVGENNILAVKVDNSLQKNCRWYSGSGIYRNVWLKVTEKTYLKDWGLNISTPEINSKFANVKIQSEISGPTDLGGKLDLKVRIYDSESHLISSEKSTVHPKINIFTQTLKVEHPRLWSVENPYLYKVEISLYKKGKLIDQLVQNLGIRSIDYSVEQGFKLNGNKILLNGGCVHHDNGALGAAAYDQAEIRKVKLLKNAGFNAVRTSHNPPSEAFLDACDSLGLLVIDEIFDGWKEEKNKYDYSTLFEKRWKEDVDSWILRDRNHPSIIMWSIGNEIIERKSPDAIRTARMLSDAVKLNDNTRPVTSAMTTWDNTWEIYDSLMAQHDVAGYNYQLHHAERDHERVPSRIILQTESYPKDAFYCWNLVNKHNYIIGDFVWTAMDYLGESGIGRYYYPGEPDGEHWSGNLFPWHGAYCGDIDLTGWRKPISHYRSMLYNDNEKLYMAVREPNPLNGIIKTTMWAVWPTWESWTWPGFERTTVQVEIYSKYPQVRLYLNNELLGQKPTGISEEFKAVFDVPYAAGELKAVGLMNGSEIEAQILRSAGEVSRINLVSDKSFLKADGQDLIFVDVELEDENGILNPNAENLIDFQIEGPASIIAVSNGNLKDTDLYTGNQRKAWKGRAQVVLRSTLSPGQIKLKVNAGHSIFKDLILHSR